MSDSTIRREIDEPTRWQALVEFVPLPVLDTQPAKRTLAGFFRCGGASPALRDQMLRRVLRHLLDFLNGHRVYVVVRFQLDLDVDAVRTVR